MIRPRFSIARLMAVVALVAINCAAVLAQIELWLLILLLDFGAYRLASRRGTRQPFWLGCSAVGWTLVVATLLDPIGLWFAALVVLFNHFINHLPSAAAVRLVASMEKFSDVVELIALVIIGVISCVLALTGGLIGLLCIPPARRMDPTAGLNLAPEVPACAS